MGLANEMQRLLAHPPYGALSALARHVGLTSASVSAWRYGQAEPTSERWMKIEEFMGLPVGHLRRASEGKADPLVQPSWVHRRISEGLALLPIDERAQLIAETLDQVRPGVDAVGDAISDLVNVDTAQLSSEETVRMDELLAMVKDLMRAQTSLLSKLAEAQAEVSSLRGEVDEVEELGQVVRRLARDVELLKGAEALPAAIPTAPQNDQAERQ